MKVVQHYLKKDLQAWLNGFLRTSCVGNKLHEWIYSLNEYLPSNNEYSTLTSHKPTSVRNMSGYIRELLFISVICQLRFSNLPVKGEFLEDLYSFSRTEKKKF